MKTQKEIVKRIEERKKDDMFGWEVNEYVCYLNFKNAKPYLKKEVTEESWGKAEKMGPVEKIKDYMDFAWQKANGCRGISADGQDEFLKKWNNLEDYEYYGKPQLIAICELYGINWKKYDDGVRTNTG